MKTNTLFRCAAGVITLAAACAVFSQSREIAFRHLTIEDGMSQNGGYCFAQDDDGFILIGTEAGLNKYDGYAVTVYESDVQDSTSISNNTVLSLCKDRAGVIWAGTENGLNIFNVTTERFTRYLHDPDDPHSLSHGRVYSICEDGKGNLWIGTENGLNRFERATGRFVRYYHDPGNANSLSHNSVRSVCGGAAGVLWIGTYGGGVNRFDPAQNHFLRFMSAPDDPDALNSNLVLCVYEDKEGVLWAGTDRGGLNRLNPDGRSFKKYVNASDNPASISDNQVNVVFEDAKGALWIGTGIGGLNYFNREKEVFYTYRNNPGDPGSLSFDRVLSVFEDTIGGLWIGTRGGGVNIFYQETHKFVHYKQDPDNPQSLSNNMIWRMHEDKAGYIWIGTDNGGLNRFDRKRDVFTHYLHDPSNPNSLSYNRVLEICEDSAGILWLGTNGGGLNKFNPKTGQFTHYKHDPHNPNSLCDDRVISMMMDRFGILWIGTRGAGFDTFDPATGQFTHHKHDPGDPNSISNDRVYFFHEDRAGALWIGTFHGLNRYDRETRRYTRFLSDPADPRSLSDNMVFTFCEDSQGTMWFGTGNRGLNKYHAADNTFTRYTKKEGLPDNVIYKMLEDDNGNLWLSTNRGLSCFNPRTGTFKNYDKGDGLQSNEFNTLAALKSRSGELFFGGVNGFNVFHPDSLKDNPHIPPVKITSLQLFNKNVPAGPMADGRILLEKSITKTDAITLSWQDNVFSFEFVALHFIAPEKNQYAYMMEGLEKEWNQAGNRRFVSYTRVPPGAYTFRVKASNSDGVWNEEGVALRIKIVPPFWRTWWFYSISAVIAGLVLLAVFFSIVNRIKRQKEEEEQRKAMETYSRVFEQGTAAVYRRNSADDTYEYMGSGIKDITGYDAGDFSFSFWKKIIIEIDTGGKFSGLSLEDIYRKVHEAEIKNLVMDLKIQTKNGDARWIRDMTAGLYDKAGICYATFGIFFDITDRKLVEDELRQKKEVMEKDLEMAREVQMALLSQNYPRSFPEHVPEEQRSLTFLHRYIPASSLAGDFFEILPLSDHQVGVMVYDVMGHGVRASLLTAYLHGLVEELMPVASDPAIFMKRLNAGLSTVMARFLSGMFATAFYLVVDVKRGVVSFTNAGHPKPYILRRSIGEVERLMHKSNQQEPALGLLTRFDYTVAEYPLCEDDIVLFYTDGIYEVENAAGEMFGEKRFFSEIKNKVTVRPDQILDEIVDDIHRYMERTDFADDVCLVSMHVKNLHRR